jgi:radical SAM superfamily enzyme YgiQ (UPF0313 family)
MAKTFHVIMIKPVRYDDDGYPIHWRRIVYPSFSLSLLNGMVENCEARKVLGPDVTITVESHDDQCGIPPVKDMIARIRAASEGGLFCIVGAHTAQFPRAMALGRQFRDAGIPVIMGGSHVSGCMSSMPEPAPDLREMMDIGVSLFVGEAEERFDEVMIDAHAGTLKPMYLKPGHSADMATALLPNRVPKAVESKLVLGVDPIVTVEAGRGCPFLCSFCTVINVHGRKPRSRTAETVACFIRDSVSKRRTRFLFTDDNFARNTNWRPILMELIRLREEEGLSFSFIIQVDTQSDRDPDFIPLAARAGCVQVFVGMESINPESLKSVAKKQNAVDRYRRFFQAWKRHGIVTMVGYIIGFHNETPETIRRDVETIKRDLAIDLLYVFILTPLPGSDDHSRMFKAGVPLDPDLGRYTTFHLATPHPHMSASVLEGLYREVWRTFYDDAHVEKVLRRHKACGGNLDDVTPFQLVARGAFPIDNINPAEYGIMRVKRRLERRPGLPIEPLIPYMARRSVEGIWAQLRWGWELVKLLRIRNRVAKADVALDLSDAAWEGMDDGLAATKAEGVFDLEGTLKQAV